MLLDLSLSLFLSILSYSQYLCYAPHFLSTSLFILHYPHHSGPLGQTSRTSVRSRSA